MSYITVAAHCKSVYSRWQSLLKPQQNIYKHKMEQFSPLSRAKLPAVVLETKQPGLAGQPKRAGEGDKVLPSPNFTDSCIFL